MQVAVRSLAHTSFGVAAAQVEVDVSNQGLPIPTVLGAGPAGKESFLRVRAILRDQGWHFAAKKLTVNYVCEYPLNRPAELDVALAVGLLQAYELLPPVANSLFCGELHLDGSIFLTYPLGIFQKALSQPEQVLFPFLRNVFAPRCQNVLVASNIQKVCTWIQGQKTLLSPPFYLSCPPPVELQVLANQPVLLRSLTIAAAGGHSLFMYGPPGTGKTTATQVLQVLLPSITEVALLEFGATQEQYSEFPLGKVRWGCVPAPLVRPEIQATRTAVFGSTRQKEQALLGQATSGILFLDELPLRESSVISALRTYLEEDAPAPLPPNQKPLLTAAGNPCPCGFADSAQVCSCSTQRIRNYRKRLTTPLLDRFELVSFVPTPVNPGIDPAQLKLYQKQLTQLRTDVLRVREFLRNLPDNKKGTLPAQWKTKDLQERVQLSATAQNWLKRYLAKHPQSPRRYTSLQRVAYTISCLNKHGQVEPADLAEAAQQRPEILWNN